jgi:hypothetical protein
MPQIIPESNTQPSRSPIFYLRSSIIAGLILAVMVVQLVTLERYPIPSCDEAHYGNVSAVLLETGFFGDNLAGDDSPVARNLPEAGRLSVLGVAFFYKIFGVSLFAARLFSLVGYAGTAILVYLTGRAVFQRVTGILAVLIFGLSWLAIQHSHSGRPDIWVAFSSIGVFFLLQTAMEKRRTLFAGLAGLTAGLALEFHLNSIHFLIAAGIVGVVWAVKYRQPKWLMAFGMGAACGVGLWFLNHYVLTPSANMTTEMFAFQGVKTAQTSFIAKMSSLVAWWWRQYFVGTQYEMLVPGLYFGLGAIVLLIRRELYGRLLVLYVTISAISSGMLNPALADYYRILWIPALSLISAEALRTLATIGSGPVGADSLKWKPKALLALAAPLLVLYLIGDIYLLYKFRNVDYTGMVQQFRSHISPGTLVASEATWWFGLTATNRVSDDIRIERETMGVDHSHLESAIAKVLRDKQYDYVIYDGQIACYSDNPSSAILRQVLDQECRAVATIEDPWFGANTIYACRP